MAKDAAVNISIDAMLFLQAVIDEQVELVADLTDMGEMFAGVAEVGYEKIAEAQAGLDRMIEADGTWQTPSSSEWCVMVYDGTDTDDTIWNRCTVHDRLAMDGAYVCEGYVAPPYTGGH